MNSGQLNRGFKYGDAVFETLRVQDGKAFNLPFHQKRLESGISALKINCNFSLEEIIKKAALKNGFLRVQITRDGASKGYLPLTNDGVVSIEVVEGFQNSSHKAKLFISSVRQNLFIKAKTSNSLHYVMALIEASENGCDNALLLDANKNICECASGNIFWIKGREIFTPSLDLNLIAGSVQSRILQNYNVTQGVFGIESLKNADEIFMSNVNVLVMPFTEILPLGIKYKTEESLNIKHMIENELA